MYLLTIVPKLVITISVLYVDDEAPMLELFQRYLERTHEFTITTASSAPAGLRLLKTNSIQAIVSDYQMPGMDGIAFLKQVRAIDKYIPFIIFTGKGWEAIAVEAFENGADFYLQKGGDKMPSSSYANLMHKIKMAVEQRRVERALVESELRYRRLFETAQDAILILDGETGEIIDANPFLLDLLVYPLDFFLGKHLWELGFIRDETLAKEAFTELKTKGYVRYDDLPLERKDGMRMDVEFISNSYLAGDRKIIQCNIRDITDRKRHEAALKESEFRYHRLLNVLNEGIWSIDKDALTTYVNPRMAGMLGYAVDEMLGRSLFAFMDEPSGKIARENLERRQQGIREQHDFEFVKKDGTRMYASLEAGPITDNDGRYIGAIAAVQDITKRKAAEEALAAFSEDLERKVVERTADLTDTNLKLVTEIRIRMDAEKHLTQSIREKEILLREVHHRVKNNLQIIISLLNLQSRFISDERTLSAFRDSQTRIRTMALVHERLYHSADLDTIDLGPFLRFLGENLFSFLGTTGKGIRLTMDVTGISLPMDTAIPLGLIINELISNSLKYAFPEGRTGEISLAVHRQDQMLTILVRDNGAGIPEGFDWRNTASMGLRLVILLVEQLDGTIDLDRSSGTAFTIVLHEKV